MHSQKLSGRLQLWAHSLSSNHILHSLIESNSNTISYQHSLLLNSLTQHQCELIKGHLVDMDNYFNEVFLSFDPLNPKISSCSELLIFSLVIFLFIYLVNAKIKISNHKSNNLIIWLSIHQVLHQVLLLLQMLVSKTMLLPSLHISIYITNQLSKLFIMPQTSQVLRLSYSPLDVVSTKPPI